MRGKFSLAVSAVFALTLVTLAIAVKADEPPKVVILKGSPLGAVKFDHAKHVASKIACETCHHASKPEKAMSSEHQKCTDCHTKVAAAPMKTKLQAAFHDPMAKKGTCIGCHVKKAAEGIKTPSKCNDCHKKANG